MATGAITLVSGGEAAEAGGNLGSDVTSISADGKLIAYESLATDLGGAPVTVGQDSVPFRGYIYNAASGKTSNVDGTNLIYPAATTDTVAVNTYDPVLSNDGTKVFYDVALRIGLAAGAGAL